MPPARAFWCSAALPSVSPQRWPRRRERSRSAIRANPAYRSGPVAKKAQFDRVNRYIQLGIEQGASLLAGGVSTPERGWFVRPTIFANANNEMAIARDEIFGPVGTVITFDSEEEAVALANDSTYGLAATVWTTDLARAHRVAAAVKVGAVGVNCWSPLDANLPWGGVKTRWHRTRGRFRRRDGLHRGEGHHRAAAHLKKTGPDRPAAAEAFDTHGETTMNPTDEQSTDRYPTSLRMLHWLRAALVAGLLWAGWHMTGMPDEVASKFELDYPWQKSFGVLTFPGGAGSDRPAVAQPQAATAAGNAGEA